MSNSTKAYDLKNSDDGNAKLENSDSLINNDGPENKRKKIAVIIDLSKDDSDFDPEDFMVREDLMIRDKEDAILVEELDHITINNIVENRFNRCRLDKAATEGIKRTKIDNSSNQPISKNILTLSSASTSSYSKVKENKSQNSNNFIMPYSISSNHKKFSSDFNNLKPEPENGKPALHEKTSSASNENISTTSRLSNSECEVLPSNMVVSANQSINKPTVAFNSCNLNDSNAIVTNEKPKEKYTEEYFKKYGQKNIPIFDSNSDAKLTADQLKETLKVIEHELATSENKVETPTKLSVPLLEHQKIGLGWMLSMEDLGKGGLLADDMGLGKTLQIIALIVEQKLRFPEDKETTLIVGPVSVMYQWELEFKTKTEKNFLKVLVLHNSTFYKNVENLANYDVVITTYGSLNFLLNNPRENKISRKTVFKGSINRRAAKQFFQNKEWTRVVLDEAHTIRNRKSKAALACFQLKADFRWCLTGTPIQNGIEDIFPIIAFLGIKPFSNWYDFNRSFGKGSGLTSGSINLPIFNLLLKRFCLRRNKSTLVDGKPLLDLPPKEVIFNEVRFTDSEAKFYDVLKNNAVSAFRTLMNSKKIRRYYVHILACLLRLRQACLHPALTNIMETELLDDNQPLMDNTKKSFSAEIPSTSSNERELIDKVDAINQKRISVLLNINPHEEPCPICFDNGVHLQVISPCGDYLCISCISKLDNSNQTLARCPKCNAKFELSHAVSLITFQKLKEAIVLDESDDEHVCTDSNKLPPSNIPTNSANLLSDSNILNPEHTDNINPSINILNSIDTDSYECLTSPTSSKIERLIQILKETISTAPTDKTIVYAQFTSSFPIILKALKAAGIECLSYTGAMTAVERNKVVTKFTVNQNIPVMLVSLLAGSVGLNLVMANRVVFMDMWWNPAIELQAIDRVHRIGQTKPVKAIRLITFKTVEQYIYQLQQKKLALIRNTIESNDDVMANFRGIGIQDLIKIFKKL